MAIKLGGQAINPQILNKANSTKKAEGDGKTLAKALKPGETLGNNRQVTPKNGPPTEQNEDVLDLEHMPEIVLETELLDNTPENTRLEVDLPEKMPEIILELPE